MLATPTQRASLVKLFHQGRRLTYGKGEFIIRPGENSPGIFYIVEGLVKAYDITKYGEENLLIIKGAGEVISLISTITGDDREIIYSTLAPTVVWLLDKEIFLAELQSKPEITIPLLEMVTEMYKMHGNRILNLEYRSVRERLISFLITTAQRFGEKTKDGGILITVPLRQQDIASSISATRETTGRQLSYLERHNLVTKRHSLITLHNVDKLRDYL